MSLGVVLVMHSAAMLSVGAVYFCYYTVVVMWVYLVNRVVDLIIYMFAYGKGAKSLFR